MDLLRRSALALWRDPGLLLVSLGFMAVQYVTGLKAGVLDIQSPWWILTMAVILLGSPLVHTWLIIRSRALFERQRVALRSALSQMAPCFVRLLLGEIVVNALVLGGLVAFLIPGVYIGIRLIYYKQAIIIEHLSLSAALFRSAEFTVEWRTVFAILGQVTPIWTISFAVVAAATFFEFGIAGDVLITLGSAVSFAWVNAFLTLRYRNRSAMSEAPGR